MLHDMECDLSNLPDSTAQLKQIIRLRDEKIERLSAEVRLLRQALFAPKSEKRIVDPSPQYNLFDLPENPPAENEDDAGEVVVVPEHIRSPKGRKALPADLPRIEVVHDLAEEEKLCACGCRLSRIGEDVSEKLDIIPARMQVIRHIRPKYACKNCEGVETEGAARSRLRRRRPRLSPRAWPRLDCWPIFSLKNFVTPCHFTARRNNFPG